MTAAPLGKKILQQIAERQVPRHRRQAIARLTYIIGTVGLSQWWPCLVLP